ncbi:hypothetical protein UlMin_010175 [Ulmus minor]
MSNMQQNFNAGQCEGQAQEKAEQWVQSTKDTTNAAREKTGDVAQCVSNSAQQGKDQTTGIIHQTVDSMKNTAQDAVDTVKNTLGMKDSK